MNYSLVATDRMQAVPPTNGGPQEDRAVLKRLVVTFLAIIGLIVPTAVPLSATAPLERLGCKQNLANATANVAAMRARVKSISSAPGPAICNATSLYFFEMVKVRALTAACKNGPDHERELGRLDADVEQINEAIAARCS